MTSAIERLNIDVTLPFDSEALLSKDPKRLEEYILILVKTIQDLLNRVSEVANLGIDLNDGEALYLGLKDASGAYPDGTWRLIIVSGALEMQKKISGTFTKIAKHNN